MKVNNFGRVNCRCGWSWDKKDSDPEDMYVCHKCGHDNEPRIKLYEEFVRDSHALQYNTPDFENEWEEAKRYPEFEEMGKSGWIDLANRGMVIKFSKIKEILGNVDLDFDGLEEPKKERFETAFKSGVVEMPIAVRFPDGGYDLVAGNTRLAGLIKNNIDPSIWIVKLK